MLLLMVLSDIVVILCQLPLIRRIKSSEMAEGVWAPAAKPDNKALSLELTWQEVNWLPQLSSGLHTHICGHTQINTYMEILRTLDRDFI